MPYAPGHFCRQAICCCPEREMLRVRSGEIRREMKRRADLIQAVFSCQRLHFREDGDALSCARAVFVVKWQRDGNCLDSDSTGCLFVSFPESSGRREQDRAMPDRLLYDGLLNVRSCRYKKGPGNSSPGPIWERIIQYRMSRSD